MKRFIISIFKFFFPIILIAYGVDLFISHYLKKSSTYARLEYPIWNAVLEGNLNSDIWVHGSSRAWVHFSPKILKDSLGVEVYNLGVDGHTFNMQNLRHQLALKHNKKPKAVIYSVDATTLQKGNFFNSEQILPYMLWNDEIYESTEDYNFFSSIDYKLPLIRYYGKADAISIALKNAFASVPQPEKRIRGYRGQDRQWNTDFEKAKKKLKAFNIVIDNELKTRFRHFIRECREKEIEVFLVYAPVYIEGQVFIKNEEEVKAVYQDIAKENNFDFIDFSNHSICMDKAYLYNARKLNRKGAELFTKELSSI